MVLNVQDEVINGTPKYNITPNGDGTNSIELANEVISDGTQLNKALFDKIENVLSYQVPSYTQSTITQTLNTKDLLSSQGSDWSSTTENVATTNTILGLFHAESDTTSTPSWKPVFHLFDNDDSTTAYFKPSNSTSKFGFENVNIILKKLTLQNGAGGQIRLYGIKEDSTKTMIGTYYQILSGGQPTTLNINNTNEYKYYSIDGRNSDFLSTEFGMEFEFQQLELNMVLDNLTSIVNNQRVLIQTPNNVGSFVATLNSISVDTILNENKYYELVYNSSQNKFIAQEVRN